MRLDNNSKRNFHKATSRDAVCFLPTIGLFNGNQKTYIDNIIINNNKYKNLIKTAHFLYIERYNCPPTRLHCHLISSRNLRPNNGKVMSDIECATLSTK